MKIEERIRELGFELPAAPTPVANYIPARKVGKLVYVSGQSTRDEEGNLPFRGKLGRELSVEEGYRAAQLAILNSLAAAKSVLESLDQIEEVVRVRGFVNCTPDFGEQPEVVNGASDTLVEIFGDRGRHARSALGTSALPRGVAVEVELILRVRD